MNEHNDIHSIGRVRFSHLAWVPRKTATSRVYHMIRFPCMSTRFLIMISELNSLYRHLDLVFLRLQPFYEYTTGRTVSGVVRRNLFSTSAVRCIRIARVFDRLSE